MTTPLIVLVCAMMGAALTGLLQRPLDLGEMPARHSAFQIDVNSADADTLCLLPGIGKQLAETMIRHRSQRGPFESIDQIQEVRGIGQLTVERMRHLAHVGGKGGSE